MHFLDDDQTVPRTADASRRSARAVTRRFGSVAATFLGLCHRLSPQTDHVTIVARHMAHEIVVVGVPVSFQGDNAKHKNAWKERVAEAARVAIAEEDKYLEDTQLSILIVQYCFDWFEGDLDNIAKLILDGLSGPAYSDDRQIEQIILRRTELGRDRIEVLDPSALLAATLDGAYEMREDFVYVRIGSAPDHRRLP